MMNRRIRRFHGLTRREREIMNVLYKLEKATVADVLGEPESTCSASDLGFSAIGLPSGPIASEYSGRLESLMGSTRPFGGTCYF